MSLVNDMLNDLDDRRSQKAREEVNLDWMTGQKQTSKNKWLMPLMTIVVIAAITSSSSIMSQRPYRPLFIPWYKSSM